MDSREMLSSIFNNLEVGIGEVSNLIGVSQRQLRYWESKGYIKPVEDTKAGVRRYNLGTVYLIAFIKSQLDEGFTLAAAVKRSKDVRVRSKLARKFFEKSFKNIKVTDPEKLYGEIDFGMIRSEDGIDHHFIGVLDENGKYFKVDD